METRANYALIGVFTLAVIASAFMFVLWFSGADKPAGRRTYQIVFNGSISGLSRGAWVLFNGLRVGEVTKIDLMPDPSKVYALIDVDARVPVKLDTKARLEYTGFTGVASVALTGGSFDAAALVAGGNGAAPIIYADRSDFQDLLETAQKLAGKMTTILDKSNALLDDNAGTITKTVTNVETFSKALADNSGGIKDFLTAMSDLGKAITPLSAKLQSLSDSADDIVKSVDKDKVKSIVNDFASLSGKLNTSADKIDGVLTNLNAFLASDNNKGVAGDISEAARSIRKLADNLDTRTKEMSANINRFTGPGLRQYEALAADGRKTLDEINRTMRSLDKNPQQLIFGKKPQIPEYTGR
jgi:phospholipid/cholesterol/gamma-HCH transport system substrate-binding protein